MATECRAGVLNAPTILPPNAAQLASMAVDYHHYRKLVVPVWNIVRYNALGGGGGDGSNLYGTEPWSFYVKNLFLNFNFTFLVALTSAIVRNTMRHPPSPVPPYHSTLSSPCRWFLCCWALDCVTTSCVPQSRAGTWCVSWRPSGCGLSS